MSLILPRSGGNQLHRFSTTIPSLPAEIATVPKGPAYKLWLEQALSYRTLIRETVEDDNDARDAVLDLCAEDAAYEMFLFGAVLEPRDQPGRPKGWYPMMPYGFQVQMIRAFDEIYGIIPGEAANGRSDLVIEKSRGMAYSWTATYWAGNRWKYDDLFLAGLVSYRKDAVEVMNDPGTMFYKLKANLGLNDLIPESYDVYLEELDQRITVPLAPPAWMIPEAYDPDATRNPLVLAHPSKTNVIKGSTTTARSTTGDRLSILFIDEGGKFLDFGRIWNSATSVTDHKVVGSTADRRYGDSFRELAKASEQANSDGTKGATFLRVYYTEHPLMDEAWRTGIEDRHIDTEESASALAREIDIDYDAGEGTHMYTELAEKCDVLPLEFDPLEEELAFTIDPGGRDRTAIHLIDYNSVLDKHGLLASYGAFGKPAEFYASLVVGKPISQLYNYGAEEERIMEWFDRYLNRITLWVGDPSGEAKNGGKFTSFYDDFRLATHELTGKKRSIKILSSNRHEYNHLRPRISALRWLLPKLQINDMPDTRKTLQAIMDHRFQEEPEGETTRQNTETVRHWGHDFVTSMEFYAVWRRLGDARHKQANKNKPQQERNKVARGLGGKPRRSGGGRWGT